MLITRDSLYIVNEQTYISETHKCNTVCAGALIHYTVRL